MTPVITIVAMLNLPLAPREPPNIRKSTAGTGKHICRANTAMRIAGYVINVKWLPVLINT
jgi:hypothetical protein